MGIYADSPAGPPEATGRWLGCLQPLATRQAIARQLSDAINEHLALLLPKNSRKKDGFWQEIQVEPQGLSWHHKSP